MKVEIIVAIIGLAGVIVTAIASVIVQLIMARQSRRELLANMQHQSEMQDQRIEAKISQYIAVTDNKIDELTREVREHNNYARRMPAVEERLEGVDRRLENLERRAAS